MNVLHNIPVPYRLDLFQHVAQHSPFDLQVYFFAARKKWRDWDVDLDPALYKVLPGISIRRPGSEHVLYFNPSVIDMADTPSCDVLVLLGYDSPSCWLAMERCRKSDLPYILWSESTVYERSLMRSLASGLLRRAVAGASACIATSPMARDFLVERGADPDRVAIIPNVPDISSFQSRRSPTQTNGVPRILFVGQLIRRKRVTDLLSAIARLLDDFPQLALHIVGSGPQEDRLKVQAHRLDIYRNVVFHGFLQRNELARVYNQSGIFVLPSVEETFGAVLAEAMASGLPVIASSASGAAGFLVRHRETGLLVPPRDDQALESALRELISDPELRASLAVQGQSKVVEICSIQRLAQEFERIVSLAAHDHVRRPAS